MSEPTPLSDCETQVYYGYSCGIVAEQAATIDAQATEIAALKGALEELREYTVDRESIANVMHIRGYGKPPDVTALRERIDALIGPYKARVLAGKEAQGGNNA